MLEHGLAVGMLQVLVQPHPMPRLAQDAGQRGLAHLKRLSPQVIAVKLQEIEGVEECLLGRGRVTYSLVEPSACPFRPQRH